MQGLTMDYQLTLGAIFRRAEALNASREVVSRLPDGTIERSSYRDVLARAKRLAVALQALGIRPGDRVATLCWNHRQHLECYFGIPAAGAVVHTLNPRLHPDELAYVATHGGDRLVVVDESLAPLLERFRERTPIEHVLVVGSSYEAALDAADPAEYREHDAREPDAAALCYTSGTTGEPKGVLYSHRALALHALHASLPDALGIREADVVLPVVPMFHANAWGMPVAAAMLGAKLVLPGPFLDGESLLDLLAGEGVTVTGGVPTVWLAVLRLLDEWPGRWDVSALRALVVGGSAAPRSLIAGFQGRHGVPVRHAWGMTEMSPIGSFDLVPHDALDAPPDRWHAFREKQGAPVVFCEFRARGADGLVPWDGATMGELEVRGAAVASAYYESPASADRWTDDGWFRTGDIVTIDGRGQIEIHDRAKDVIKSGGEWISSVALENALMAHPAVAEAAVVGVPDERWGERPLAAVVLRDGRAASPEELREFLAPRFARFWLPERFEFVGEIPRTSTGKFKKLALRELYAREQVVT